MDQHFETTEIRDLYQKLQSTTARNADEIQAQIAALYRSNAEALADTPQEDLTLYVSLMARAARTCSVDDFTDAVVTGEIPVMALSKEEMSALQAGADEPAWYNPFKIVWALGYAYGMSQAEHSGHSACGFNVS